MWPAGVMSGILTKNSQVQGPVHESETMDFPQNENTSLFPESIFLSLTSNNSFLSYKVQKSIYQILFY